MGSRRLVKVFAEHDGWDEQEDGEARKSYWATQDDERQVSSAGGLIGPKALEAGGATAIKHYCFCESAKWC